MTTSRGDASTRHTPVMCARIVELFEPVLRPREGSAPIYVDATLGMGGHTEAILNAYPTAIAYGIDRDAEALRLAAERLRGFGDRFRAVHAVYDEAWAVLDARHVGAVDAILFDLGVSSLQLDEADRGFAYSQDAPLDMRMDQSCGMTAADVLNTYSASELTRILRDFGEERFAKRVASAIVRERELQPFSSSGRLMEVLRTAIPAASQRSGGHPGKRTFQALRIEVNRELDAWNEALPAAIDRLAVGGRMAVLAYHSLEDRIAKRAFVEGSKGRTPPGIPVELPQDAAYLRQVVRGAEQPDADEMNENPRAASARLRVVERIRSTKGTVR